MIIHGITGRRVKERRDGTGRQTEGETDRGMNGHTDGMYRLVPCDSVMFDSVLRGEYETCSYGSSEKSVLRGRRGGEWIYHVGPVQSTNFFENKTINFQLGNSLELDGLTEVGCHCLLSTMEISIDLS